MPLPVSDYVLISYRSDLQLLIMRWTRPATPAEHQAGYQAALQVAQEVGHPEQAGRWLIDLRSRGLGELIDLRWILHDFRDELRTALPSATRRIAYFTTPNHAATLAARIQELDPNPASDLQFQVFMEEAPAYKWLMADRAVLAAH